MSHPLTVDRLASVYIPRTRQIGEPGPANYTSDTQPEEYHVDSIYSGVAQSGIEEADTRGEQRNFGQHSAEENAIKAEVLSDRTSLGINIDVRA